jgi:hypothetical protein
LHSLSADYQKGLAGAQLQHSFKQLQHSFKQKQIRRLFSPGSVKQQQ